jgi:hypothetical protein
MSENREGTNCYKLIYVYLLLILMFYMVYGKGKAIPVQA